MMTPPPMPPSELEQARIIKYLWGQAPDMNGAYYQDVMSWEEFRRQDPELAQLKAELERGEEMKLSRFSVESQDGLRQWAKDTHNDDMMLDDINGNLEAWSWVYFQLRLAEDRREWFPKGKWAVVQHLESLIEMNAKEILRPHE